MHQTNHKAPIITVLACVHAAFGFCNPSYACTQDGLDTVQTALVVYTLLSINYSYSKRALPARTQGDHHPLALVVVFTPTGTFTDVCTSKLHFEFALYGGGICMGILLLVSMVIVHNWTLT